MRGIMSDLRTIEQARRTADHSAQARANLFFLHDL
jgi:hypothetical protein